MQGLYFCLSCLFFIVFLSILNVDAVEVRGRLKLSNKWTKYRQQEQGSTVSLKIPVTYKENEEDQAKKKELGRQEREVRQAEKEDLQRELATKEKLKRLETEENTLITKSTLGESKKWCEARPKFDRMRYQVDCSSMLQVDVDSIKAAF